MEFCPKNTAKILQNPKSDNERAVFGEHIAKTFQYLPYLRGEISV